MPSNLKEQVEKVVTDFISYFLNFCYAPAMHPALCCAALETLQGLRLARLPPPRVHGPVGYTVRDDPKGTGLGESTGQGGGEPSGGF